MAGLVNESYVFYKLHRNIILIYNLILYCFFHINLVTTPKTISSTLKKTQQSKAIYKILPTKNPELINSSDTSQYDNLTFIGNPAVPTKINIHKLSRLLNIGIRIFFV